MPPTTATDSPLTTTKGSRLKPRLLWSSSDGRIVDVHCCSKCEVAILDSKRHRDRIPALKRNEQLVRIKDVPAEHLGEFVEYREAVISHMLPVGTLPRPKRIWALDDADGFARQILVLIALPDKVDAVVVAHDWPGWFSWAAKGTRHELSYRNRFAYCSYCKDSAPGSKRHLRADCPVAPPMDVDDEDLNVDDEDVVYDDEYFAFDHGQQSKSSDSLVIVNGMVR